MTLQGIADGNRIARDVPDDDASAPDHDIAPDRDAGHDLHAAADPHMIAYGDGIGILQSSSRRVASIG